MHRFRVISVLVLICSSSSHLLGGETASKVCKRNKKILQSVSTIQHPTIKPIGPTANKINDSWTLTICSVSNTEADKIKSLGVFLSKGKKDYILGKVLPYLSDSNTTTEHYSSTSPVQIVAGQSGRSWVVNRTDSSKSYGDIGGFNVQLFSVFGISGNGPDKLRTFEGYSGGGDGGQYMETDFKFTVSDKGELLVDEIITRGDVTVNEYDKSTTRYILR